jgi:hypothetical protein
MALGQHNDIWFERQNKALGLPPGTRHSDDWYARAHQQAQAQQAQQQQLQAQQHQASVQNTLKEQQVWAQQQQQGANAKAEADRIAAEKAKADADAKAKADAEKAKADAEKAKADAEKAETERQARGVRFRDEWDALNKQGIHDSDGWQSTGYQPDRIAMPNGWDGMGFAPPAPPAPPAAPPPAAPPPPPPPPGTPGDVTPDAPAAPPTNALLPVAGGPGSTPADSGVWNPASWIAPTAPVDLASLKPQNTADPSLPPPNWASLKPQNTADPSLPPPNWASLKPQEHFSTGVWDPTTGQSGSGSWSNPEQGWRDPGHDRPLPAGWGQAPSGNGSALPDGWKNPEQGWRDPNRLPGNALLQAQTKPALGAWDKRSSWGSQGEGQGTSLPQSWMEGDRQPLGNASGTRSSWDWNHQYPVDPAKGAGKQPSKPKNWGAGFGGWGGPL